MAGILDKQYHEQRKNRVDLSYRLARRSLEVKNVINKFFRDKVGLNCLDIGTADGLMLSKLNHIFRFKRVVGIDLSEELIRTNKDKSIELRTGNAEKLEFSDNEFDIIIACAVIEHLDNAGAMLSEAHRVLKTGGIIIITTPNPFQDKIANLVGYIKEASHIKNFNIEGLKEMLVLNNFKPIYSKYFMLFPFFRLPLENQIESLVTLIKLKKLMSNQLIVGRKINRLYP